MQLCSMIYDTLQRFSKFSSRARAIIKHVCLTFWDHQRVPGADRIDVKKCKGGLVVHEFERRNLATDYVTEYARWIGGMRLVGRGHRECSGR